VFLAWGRAVARVRGLLGLDATAPAAGAAVRGCWPRIGGVAEVFFAPLTVPLGAVMAFVLTVVARAGGVVGLESPEEAIGTADAVSVPVNGVRVGVDFRELRIGGLATAPFFGVTGGV